MCRKLFLVVTTTATMLSILPLQAVAQDELSNTDVLNISLQQLADMDVTSVSKRTEKFSQVAAALYVITQEDIYRSGLQSIPELLRMVPGLQVAQSGSQNWAVTSRGFDSQYANKLLVLIDGRTVYSPIFSGVYWELNNLPLDDIDRIEVIRGPGATVWGANAVNGVINIITKNAKETQGSLVTALAGNEERFSSGARYGGHSGDLYYRTYGQYSDYNQQHTLTGAGAGDPWDNGQGGFRLDWDGAGRDTGTLQGDAYKGSENVNRNFPVTSAISPSLIQTIADTDHVSGMNVLGRWKHEFSRDSDITWQAYYDDNVRHFFDYGYDGASFHTQTLDFDFQHDFVANKYNNLTWGLGYRRISSDFGNSFYINFSPENYYENLYSGFVQDKISLVQDKLFLTLGSKFEHNDFSGFEYEPSAKLAFTPTDSQTLWASVSRAVRTPNQANQDIRLILAAVPHSPTEFLAEGSNVAAAAEKLTAYEIGYRVMPRDDFSIDVTGFYNDYTQLVSASNGSASLQFDPLMGNYIYAPLIPGNNNSGETHGIEVASTWQATKSIKLNGSYSIYASHLNIIGSTLVTKQGTAPNQQFSLRSYMDLPHRVQWDTMLYRVESLPALSVPGYVRLDTRLGWTPIQGLDLSLIGQNLLRSEHQEFTPFLYQSPEEISRAVIAKATFQF
jgi:iron complex outermembrane recepter protein